MRRSRAGIALLFLSGLALVSQTATASAATTLGSNAVAGACVGGTYAYVQPVSPPSTSYTAPSNGVITSWSYQTTGAAPTTIKLRVLRPTNTADTYTTIGLSQTQSPPFNQLSTYPTRIPVQAGDFIGFTATSAGNFPCGENVAGFTAKFDNTDTALGSTAIYGTVPNFQVDISAALEADADGDGFGDETQDLCPSDASTQGACADRTAPDTTITKKPKSKSKKRRVTIGFSSSETGSSFECSIDGSGFAPCASPLIKSFGSGKHVFQVRAVDAAGNRDGSPATVTWTVKKPKHGGGKKA